MTNQEESVASARLKSIVERVERLEEEKAGLSQDINDIFAEAKGSGFDVKVIKHILKLRAMDAEKRKELETILETYKAALGME